jgi:beta-glucosidase
MADPRGAEVIKQLAAQLNIPMGEGNEPSDDMMKYTPLRALVAFSGGMFTEDMMNMLISKLNEQY